MERLQLAKACKARPRSHQRKNAADASSALVCQRAVFAASRTSSNRLRRLLSMIAHAHIATARLSGNMNRPKRQSESVVAPCIIQVLEAVRPRLELVACVELQLLLQIRVKRTLLQMNHFCFLPAIHRLIVSIQCGFAQMSIVVEKLIEITKFTRYVDSTICGAARQLPYSKFAFISYSSEAILFAHSGEAKRSRKESIRTS